MLDSTDRVMYTDNKTESIDENYQWFAAIDSTYWLMYIDNKKRITEAEERGCRQED